MTLELDYVTAASCAIMVDPTESGADYAIAVAFRVAPDGHLDVDISGVGREGLEARDGEAFLQIGRALSDRLREVVVQIGEAREAKREADRGTPS